MPSRRPIRPILGERRRDRPPLPHPSRDRRRRGRSRGQRGDGQNRGPRTGSRRSAPRRTFATITTSGSTRSPAGVSDLNAELAAPGCRGQGDRLRRGGGERRRPISTDEEASDPGPGGRWVLLEPAPGPLGESLAGAAERLRRRGYRSLIAHPERHTGADGAPACGTLVQAGCLVQATAALLAEGAASEPMLDLARRGLVHVLASDSHSARHGRPVRISAGLARLREAAQRARTSNGSQTRHRRRSSAGRTSSPRSPRSSSS